MKKLILGFCAIATILMVGCAKDSSNGEVPAGNAINFSTYLGRDVQVRSGILDDTNLSDFGVFASYTQSADWTAASGFNFMFNQNVNNSSGSWDYTPKKYWPTKQGEKISFWAYAPYKSGKAIAVKSLKESTGLPQITYTISNIETAEDFTAATL
ncbi:MAG: fimbrillin family protein, partial [Flavobacteriales bacterium]|nr:fimbrillin family protein [Flavobacteriales bacterium]